MSETYQKLLQAPDQEALRPLLKELLDNSQPHLEDFAAELHGLLLHPDRLASDQEKRAAYAAILCLTREDNRPDTLGIQILSLCLTPEFSQHVQSQDWLLGDLSRLLGTALTGPQLPLLFEAIANFQVAVAVREQFLMAVLFRVLGKRDPRNEYVKLFRELQEKMATAKLEPNLWLALMVTSLSIGDERLKIATSDFCQRTRARYRQEFSEKLLKGFFAMEPENLRQLMLKEYLGRFGTTDEELERLYAQDNTQEVDTSVLKAPKPIVREAPKINRNAPCPCGSGKKYKKCCGR